MTILIILFFVLEKTSKFFTLFQKISDWYVPRMEILKFSILISTKSTLAPQYSAQLALATNELVHVHTISPLPTPKAKQDMCSALVALLKVVADFAPTILQSFFSKILD